MPAPGLRVDVLTSGIWQTNSVVLARGGRCLVIDPAYFPRELEAVAACAAAAGTVEAVVFSHGHWDHVMGHAAFPGVPVWLAVGLDADITAGSPRAAAYLADARDFDSRWYVPRPAGHGWPARRRPLTGGTVVDDAGVAVEVLELPGHSPDGLGLIVDGLLLPGDYLSPCEIPFVDDLERYLTTLGLLRARLGELREVIPGHGPRLTAAEARAIADADVAYLEALRDHAARGDAAAAHAMAWPRATDVVGMREHHLDNCRKLGLAGPRGPAGGGPLEV